MTGTRQKARGAIGDRAFEAEFARGLGMRFEEAAGYALDERDPDRRGGRTGVDDSDAAGTAGRRTCRRGTHQQVDR